MKIVATFSSLINFNKHQPYDCCILIMIIKVTIIWIKFPSYPILPLNDSATFHM